MTLNELKEINTKLQPHLVPGDFSFIAPTNGNEFEKYTQLVNQNAPVRTPMGIGRTIHSVLAETNTTNAITELFANQELRIYIIVPPRDSPFVFHSDVKSYCEKHGINLDNSQSEEL